MQDVSIYLRSGQVVQITCESFEITFNALGEVAAVDLVHAEGQETLLALNIPDVAAITYKRHAPPTEEVT